MKLSPIFTLSILASTISATTLTSPIHAIKKTIERSHSDIPRTSSSRHLPTLTIRRHPLSHETQKSFEIERFDWRDYRNENGILDLSAIANCGSSSRSVREGSRSGSSSGGLEVDYDAGDVEDPGFPLVI